MNTTTIKKKEVKLTSLENLGSILPSRNKEKYQLVKLEKSDKKVYIYENEDNSLSRVWDLSPWERKELGDIYLKNFYWLPKSMSLEDKEAIIRPVITKFREKVRKNRSNHYIRNEEFSHRSIQQDTAGGDSVIARAIDRYLLSKSLALKLYNNHSWKLWLKGELK